VKLPRFITELVSRMSVPRMRRLAPFDPTQIAGCLLWLDGSDPAVTGGGASVSTWIDKSPIKSNATYVTAPPPLVSSAINGLSALSFTGTEKLTGSISITGTTLSIFSVFTLNSSSGLAGRLISLAAPGTIDYANNAYTAVQRRVSPQVGIYRNGTEISSPITYSSNTLHTAYYDGTNEYVYTNGGIVYTNASSGNFSISAYMIGANLGYSSDNQPWNGYIGEVIVYNAAFTLGQRQQVEGYLAQKWGLKSNLPGGHPGLTSVIYPTLRTLTLIPRTYPSTFSATGIAGSTLWLDASDPAGNGTTPSNGSSLASWTDKSGNGLTVSAASSQPTYTTNAANGLGTVAFNGSQGLNAGSVTGGKLVGNNGSSATFCVFSVSNNTENSCPFSWDDSGYTYRFMITWAGGEGTPGLEFDFGNWPNRTQIATTGASSINFTNNTYYLVSFWQSGATAVLNVNGKTYTSIYTDFSGNWSSTASRIFNVGTYINSGGYNMKGNTAEILFYNTNIPSNFQQVEGYLAWKWGLQNSLPASHPYKSASPTGVGNSLNLTRPATLLNQYPTPKTTGGSRI